MFDVYGTKSVVIVDTDFWSYINFEKALDLKEEYGYPISFEEFETRYLETVPTDNDEVKEISDMVNSPEHYKQFSREVIDTMQGMSTPEEFKGYLKLNAVKYISRYQGKNGVEDLDKAIWYVTKLKEVLEGEQ